MVGANKGTDWSRSRALRRRRTRMWTFPRKLTMCFRRRSKKPRDNPQQLNVQWFNPPPNNYSTIIQMYQSAFSNHIPIIDVPVAIVGHPTTHDPRLKFSTSSSLTNSIAYKAVARYRYSLNKQQRNRRDYHPLYYHTSFPYRITSTVSLVLQHDDDHTQLLLLLLVAICWSY